MDRKGACWGKPRWHERGEGRGNNDYTRKKGIGDKNKHQGGKEGRSKTVSSSEEKWAREIQKQQDALESSQRSPIRSCEREKTNRENAAWTWGKDETRSSSSIPDPGKGGRSCQAV